MNRERAVTDEATEAKRVVRHLGRYSSEERASRAASHRLGHRQRGAVGEYFYTHPDVPGLAFSTRGAAARAALRTQAGRNEAAA
jgi:hypothetical protein